MADHLAYQIEQAALTLLTGLTTSGTRVALFEEQTLSTGDVPGLLIMFDGDETDLANSTRSAPRSLKRIGELHVRTVAKQGSGLRATLAAMRLEVETAIANDRSFGGLAVADTTILGWTRTFDVSTDKPCGAELLRFRVSYFARENNPTTH